MSRTRNRFAIATLAAAGLTSAALALSPTAAADPAAPAVPAVPGLDVVQQVATDVLAPQAVEQPAPMASASVNLPQPAAVTAPAQSPVTSPLGVTSPVTSPLGVTSPAGVTAPEPAVIPSADISIPQLPADLIPIPLPSEVSFPGDLLSLLPAATNTATAALTPGQGLPVVPTLPTAGLP